MGEKKGRKLERKKKRSQPVADQRSAGNLFPGYTLGTFEVVLSQQCPRSLSLFSPLSLLPPPSISLYRKWRKLLQASSDTLLSVAASSRSIKGKGNISKSSVEYKKANENLCQKQQGMGESPHHCFFSSPYICHFSPLPLNSASMHTHAHAFFLKSTEKAELATLSHTTHEMRWGLSLWQPLSFRNDVRVEKGHSAGNCHSYTSWLYSVPWSKHCLTEKVDLHAPGQNNLIYKQRL